MPRKAISLRLPEELWVAVEARADELGQTRTKFVERALEKALAGESSVGASIEAKDDPSRVEAPKRPASPRASEPSSEVPLPPKVPVRVPYRKPFVPRPKGS